MKIKPKYIISAAALVCLAVMGYRLVNKQFFLKEGDKGDAPASYGEAIHNEPEKGPCLGLLRGDNDDKKIILDGDYSFPGKDDTSNVDDEDAFALNFTEQQQSNRVRNYLPDIDANSKIYSLNVPVSYAEIGDPINAWIDFNGNGLFEAKEMASALYEAENHVTLSWLIPELNTSSVTYARLRTTNAANKRGIDIPASTVQFGEVEDYQVRIVATDLIPDRNLEMRDTINLNAFEDTTGLENINQVLQQSPFAKATMQIFFDSVKGFYPDILYLSKVHDLEHTGIRFGYNDDTVNHKRPTMLKPLCMQVKFSQVLSNLQFNLLDIDAGSQVLVEAFFKGKKLTTSFRNLTTWFFYNYNLESNVFSCFGDIDSGNDTYAYLAAHCGINVQVRENCDSISIRYWDVMDAGTLSLVNVSARMYNKPLITIPELNIKQKNENIEIIGSLKQNDEIDHITLYQSHNALDFISIKTISNPDSLINFHFAQPIKELKKNNYTYILKVYEKDGHITTGHPQNINVDLNIAKNRDYICYYNRKETSFYFVFNKTSKQPIRIVFLDFVGKITSTKIINSYKMNDTIPIRLSQQIFDETAYVRMETEGKSFFLPF